MQSTMVKRQGNWALGIKWTPQCKSVHAYDLESAESEHDKEAGHSIDWASIESASRLTGACDVGPDSFPVLGARPAQIFSRLS